MAQPPTKRARAEEPALDPLQYGMSVASIVGNLPSILQSLRAQNVAVENGNVELEVRVGMLVSHERRLHSRDQSRRGHMVDPNRKGDFGVEFRAGIDESLARKLKEKFQKMGFQATPPTVTTLYCTGKGERFAPNENGQFVPGDRKNRLAGYDFGLSSHDYDLRISIASEIKAASDSAVVASVNWEIQRRKRRVTFTHHRHAHWQIDLTEVSSQRRASTAMEASAKEVELEFELRPAVQLQWLCEADPAKQMALGQQICQQLVGLIDLCIPSEPETDSVEVLMNLSKPSSQALALPSREDAERAIAELNGALDEACARRNQQNLAARRKVNVDFLGSMPVNLFRKNLAIVLEKDYFLTEKTDGTRFLLFSLPAGPGAETRPAAVLLDRSRAMFSFAGSEALAAALGERTVLDGELVYNLTLHRSVFMVFDVLMYRGQSVVSLPFSDRLGVIMHSVFPGYQAHGASKAASLPLMVKRFVKKADLQALLGQISDHHGERVFQDKEGRHHFTDGIIFQPDSPYVFSKHYDLLKWKWADLRSVDLIALDQSTSGDLQFMCSGPNEGLVDCSKRGDRNVGVGAFDRLRLRKEMHDLLQERTAMRVIGKNIIAEVMYDVQIGMWVYKKVRKDKTEPNYIDSVLGVFIEQAEAISKEELEYALSASTLGQDNDFEYQLNKMKASLLAWQRKSKK